MTDACRVAIAHLFREMDLNRVEIRCAAVTRKSAAIRGGWVSSSKARTATLNW